MYNLHLRTDDALMLDECQELFRQKFSDHRFQRFQSRKISSVCTAHVQVREKLSLLNSYWMILDDGKTWK
jgi:hypothetical protein